MLMVNNLRHTIRMASDIGKGFCVWIEFDLDHAHVIGLDLGDLEPET
jgi:hypothetical protein